MPPPPLTAHHRSKSLVQDWFHCDPRKGKCGEIGQGTPSVGGSPHPRSPSLPSQGLGFLPRLLAKQQLGMLHKPPLPSRTQLLSAPSGCLGRKHREARCDSVNSIPRPCFWAFQAEAGREVAPSYPCLGTQPGSCWDSKLRINGRGGVV